jgi:hypothetical protein
MLALTTSFALVAAVAAPADGDDSIPWKKEIASGEAAAKTSVKPVLVVFRCER